MLAAMVVAELGCANFSDRDARQFRSLNMADFRSLWRKSYQGGLGLHSYPPDQEVPSCCRTLGTDRTDHTLCDRPQRLVSWPVPIDASS